MHHVQHDAPAHLAAPPRLAVVITPSGSWSRDGLRRWLKDRYCVPSLQTITIDAVEWNGLASQHVCRVAADRVRSRLALACLGRPALVVVLGYQGRSNMRQLRPPTRRELRQIVRRMRGWSIPVPVIGVWSSGRHRSRTAPRLCGEDDETASDLPFYRHAESVWENEGGRPTLFDPDSLAAGSSADSSFERIESAVVDAHLPESIEVGDESFAEFAEVAANW